MGARRAARGVSGGGVEVLLLCWEWPPREGAGPRRAAALAAALAARGHRVRVLTPRSLRREAPRPGPPGVEVQGLPHLSPPVHQVREAGWGRLAGLLEGALPIDYSVGWVPTAVAAGLAALRRRPAQALLATGPPHAPSLAGACLAACAGLPLVWDLRDPWLDNPLRPPESVLLAPLQRALTSRAEAWVAATASAILVTAEALRGDLAARYPGIEARVQVVRNGWDEDLRPLLDAQPPPAAGRPMRWLFAGTLLPGSDYTPLAPLQALGALAERHRLGPDQLAVQVCTSHPEWLRAQLRAWPALLRCAAIDPFTPRARLLELYRQADALLLGYPDYPGVPAKAYEYLAVSRPVLLVAPPGETRALLEEAGLALGAAPGDPAGAAAAAEALWEAFRAGRAAVTPRREVIERHARAAQLRRAVEAVEAVTRAGRPAPGATTAPG